MAVYALPDWSREVVGGAEAPDFLNVIFRSGSCWPKVTMPIDVSGFKGRIAEALVEGILRAARFKVCRLGRESQVQQMLKTGTAEFLPDFLIWKPVDQSSDGIPLHRLLSIEVKYRASIEEFLRRYGDELISRVGEQWRELYVVFVTDHPAEGRSCFQVLDRRAPASTTPLGTIDLHETQVFGINKTLIEEHERLVGQLFSPLSSSSMGELRKPPTRLWPDRAGASESKPSQVLPA